MFSIKNNIQVEEVSLDESDFILNETNLNPSLLNKKNPQINPLLNIPQNNDVKVKIRV
jgi:hypothetical protein